jgi:hypothetical protein
MRKDLYQLLWDSKLGCKEFRKILIEEFCYDPWGEKEKERVYADDFRI